MNKPANKILRYTLIILGSIIIMGAILGMYVKSIIPKPIGSPIQLQAALFSKPSAHCLMEGKYIYKSASDLASMIRHQEVTSVEVVNEFLCNIKNNNFKYNAIIWLREKEALEDAAKADAMVKLGDTIDKPLLGVPITIKEMFWVKGSPSTLNAKMFGFIAPRDAEVVEQLKSAGAVILGTTNVSFMLSDYQTQGEVYPTGNNPYDTTRTPGGSTGGGAAALAAGFSALELGSDLGGSIRIPAAFCGLYGLKTSFGAINITQGTSPDTVTKFTRFALASAGPLARNVEDLQLMWNVLKNTKPDSRFQEPINWKPSTIKSLDQYHVAWTDEWINGKDTVKVSNEVKSKLRQLIDSLRLNGVKVQHAVPDSYESMKKSFLETFASMISEGQPWLLRKFIAMDFKKLDDGTAAFNAFYEAINNSSKEKWDETKKNRQKLVDHWELFFKEHDFFICPITYGVAIKKCAQGSLLQGENAPIPYMTYFPYSYIFNATGHPSIVVPMGLNKNGLPIGLQIVGSYYSEDELLHFAALISSYSSGFVVPVRYN